LTHVDVHLVCHVDGYHAVQMLVQEGQRSLTVRLVRALISVTRDQDVVLHGQAIRVEYLAADISDTDVNQAAVLGVRDTPDQFWLAVKEH